MVIAKPEWYNIRKKSFYTYGMTWQGWIYLIAIISVLLIGLTLPQNIITNLTIDGIFIFLFMDTLIASYKSMDERGKMHYSIAMRNMAWGMMATIIITSIILNYTGINNGLNLLIIATTLIGAIIGFLTRYKLERDN